MLSGRRQLGLLRLRGLMAVAPLGDFGATTKAPTDALTKATADLLTTRDSDYVSTLLLPGVYTSGAYQKEVLGALSLCLEADAIERACKRARKHPTADEQKILEAAAAARDRIVQVQAFEKLGHAERAPGHVRPALAQTDAWLADEPAAREAAAA